MIGRILALALVFLAWGGTAWTQEPVTADECAVCHEDLVAAFAAGSHGRSMATQSDEMFQWSCEACHGPAGMHIEDVLPESISREPVAGACLGCHPASASKIELLSSAHNRTGVTCLECHDAGHAGATTEHQLLDEPRELCAGCHRIEAGTFRLPYAHREGSEPYQCDTCHSVHADSRVGRLSLLGGGGPCTDCHTDVVQPFIYPHPPADQFNCVACHMPHGSTNPKLLTRPNVDMLCLECHAGVAAFHDVSTARFQRCQTCHAAIHGSNRDPRLIEE